MGILGWWYGAGRRGRLTMIGERLAHAFDYFSIDLLIKTWFSPFRQISAGRVEGPLGVQVRAWFDRLISRLIGGFVRTIVIIVGMIWLALQVVIGAIELAFWILLPLFPVVGAIIMAIGWVPSWAL